MHQEFRPLHAGECVPEGYSFWRIDAAGRQWVRRTMPKIEGVPRDVGIEDCEILSDDDDFGEVEFIEDSE